MNIRESVNINVVLRWIMGADKTRSTLGQPTELEVRSALEDLAAQAHKCLSAGYTPEDVRRLWPDRSVRDVRGTATSKPSKKKGARKK